MCVCGRMGGGGGECNGFSISKKLSVNVTSDFSQPVCFYSCINSLVTD